VRALVPLQDVQAQFSSSKKIYLKQQMEANLDLGKLGLTREVRRQQYLGLTLRGCGGVGLNVGAGFDA
jgi:hypothetical protein